MGRAFIRGRISQIAVCLCVALTIASSTARAQGATATLTGTVVDESGAHVPGAAVTLLNTATHIKRETVSTREGSFVLPSLPPGRYTLRAQLEGFGPIQMENIVLNVDDRLVVRIELKVAPVGAEVTVVAEPAHVSTSPAVSTVIDRQFVENLPLNGRSLQALLELSPGVVPAKSGSDLEGGQFNVNGQRSNANAFTIDGVSANVGATRAVNSQFGQGGSGQLPALNAVGTTSGLVSVDALQEFRIQTSTYAPEFGRVPGAQVSMVTRAGTNVFHGSVFEYFRHDAMDATDWFVKRSGGAKPELRQHNFGGVLGGPVVRNRTFFFAAYERLRLRLPRAATVTVPGAGLRQTAAPAIRPYLNALPLPNGRDLGNGFGEFLGVFSDPSEVDAMSLRLDHTIRPGLTVFARGSYAPSAAETRRFSFSTSSASQLDTSSVTAGATWVISDRIIHDVRVNHARTNSSLSSSLDTFGGAIVPASEEIFQSGRDPSYSYADVALIGGGQFLWGVTNGIQPRQLNFVDTVTFTSKSHEWKAGLDYRLLTPIINEDLLGRDTVTLDVAGLVTGVARSYSISSQDPSKQVVAYRNLSVFVQDHWKPSSRLTMTYGVRWEFVPPAHMTSGPNPATLEGLEEPYSGRVRFAPAGSPLWKSRYNNFAPRVGGTLIVSERSGTPLVLKGGIGVYHDLGYGQIANAFGFVYPYFASINLRAQALPIDKASIPSPRYGIDSPGSIWVMDPELRLPYTIQWNVSIEQGLGTRRTLTVGYVGAQARDLLKVDRYRLKLPEFSSQQTVNVSRNKGFSDYRALQIRFQQRTTRGIQALLSYTLGKSLDTGSSDASLDIPTERHPPALDYGYSDFDVRHVFTAGVTYEVPGVRGKAVWRALTQNWGVDLMVRARSAYPIVLSTSVPFPPDNETVRPDVVPGQPFWIADPTAPAGRRLNRQAFSNPAPQTQGDLQRGAVRGFGAKQVDLALRREFRLVSPVRLQLRAEMFNVFNWTNFADPGGNLAISQGFGASRRMLSGSAVGQNALYAVGGPRSVQLAAKVLF